MHPVLFEIFGFKVYSYGVLVALAFLAGFALMVYRARKAGDNPDHYLEATIWFIIAGIGGARLFYFLWYPHLLWTDPLGTLSAGGLVWYGGVIGVAVAVILYTRIKKLPLFHFSDIMIPSCALGLAIGRIGCLLAGCCYGAHTDVPWAIHYPHTHETMGLPVHPAPLYETALMLLVLGILLKMDKHKPFAGFTTWWFFIMAGIVRFGLEYVRGDRLIPVEGFAFSNSQIVSIIGILIGIAMLVFLWNRRKGVMQGNGTIQPAPSEV
jgi:phosphatidylglycerol---prolipoprotein diacylglyceryl transferase